MSITISELPVTNRLRNEDFLIVEKDFTKKIAISNLVTQISASSGFEEAETKLQEVLSKEQDIYNKVREIELI